MKLDPEEYSIEAFENLNKKVDNVSSQLEDNVNELNKIIKAKYRVAQMENPDVLDPLPE